LRLLFWWKLRIGVIGWQFTTPQMKDGATARLCIVHG
jgi:hypothetical protein